MKSSPRRSRFFLENRTRPFSSRVASSLPRSHLAFPCASPAIVSYRGGSQNGKGVEGGKPFILEPPTVPLGKAPRRSFPDSEPSWFFHRILGLSWDQPGNRNPFRGFDNLSSQILEGVDLYIYVCLPFLSQVRPCVFPTRGGENYLGSIEFEPRRSFSPHIRDKDESNPASSPSHLGDAIDLLASSV